MIFRSLFPARPPDSIKLSQTKLIIQIREDVYKQAKSGWHKNDKKIGTNQPIICMVTLNEIKPETTQ